LDEIKSNTLNTTLYKTISDLLTEKLGQSYVVDLSWIDSANKKAEQTYERLELELTNAKTQLIKDDTRNAHSKLGDFHYSRGDLNAALKSYVRMRDYCTTSNHILQMCLNTIKVSIELSNYSHVVNYVAKAEQTPDLKDKVIISKLKIASGLANLDNKKYKQAAKKFLETTIDVGNNNELLTLQDIGTYGGLLALATFDRSELKKQVIDNVSFKGFLELVPEVRELINDFYSSHYASCLKSLEKLKSPLLLDIYLHTHVERLYQTIRSKALVQYFSPFSSIDLNTMASAFNTSISGLEKELGKLIEEGTISARIDSHNKRLYARQTDQRTATFDKSLKMGDEYQSNTKTLLLRINLLRNDFVVKPPRREEILAKGKKG